MEEEVTTPLGAAQAALLRSLAPWKHFDDRVLLTVLLILMLEWERKAYDVDYYEIKQNLSGGKQNGQHVCFLAGF